MNKDILNKIISQAENSEQRREEEEREKRFSQWQS